MMTRAAKSFRSGFHSETLGFDGFVARDFDCGRSKDFLGTLARLLGQSSTILSNLPFDFLRFPPRRVGRGSQLKSPLGLLFRGQLPHTRTALAFRSTAPTLRDPSVWAFPPAAVVFHRPAARHHAAPFNRGPHDLEPVPYGRLANEANPGIAFRLC